MNVLILEFPGTLAEEEHCWLMEAQEALNSVRTNIEKNESAQITYANISHQPRILALWIPCHLSKRCFGKQKAILLVEIFMANLDDPPAQLIEETDMWWLKLPFPIRCSSPVKILNQGS